MITQVNAFEKLSETIFTFDFELEYEWLALFEGKLDLLSIDRIQSQECDFKISFSKELTELINSWIINNMLAHTDSVLSLLLIGKNDVLSILLQFAKKH